MAKKCIATVLTQSELFSHGTSRVTVTCGELSVSDITRFADFDFFGAHFRSDHFVMMLVTAGTMEVSINLRPFTIKENLALALPTLLNR